MLQISQVKWKEEFSPFVTLNIPELSSRRAADLLAPIWCESQTQHSTTDVTPITESHLSEFLRYFYTNTNFVPLPQIYYSYIFVSNMVEYKCVFKLEENFQYWKYNVTPSSH